MHRKARWTALLAATLGLMSLSLVTMDTGFVYASEGCSTSVLFTAPPLDLEDIDFIRALGGLNPPGHVFPTDHIYFYMPRDAAGIPYVVPFYAPGAMVVLSVSASQHVKAGFTDFNLELAPCDGVTVVFMHVSTLDSEIFGDTSGFDGWDLTNEYSTGGETYRLWRKNTSIEVLAGQELGATGGRRGQYALDLGVYDSRRPAVNVANPSRWTNSRAATAVCPFDYYADGLLRDALLDLVERDGGPEDPDRCGAVFQDVLDTAQGAWFLAGISSTYPEDPHLALVYSNTHPSQAVFSVGTSIPNLESGLYVFTPTGSGVLNRAFSDVHANGTIYGYQVDRYEGIILISMPDNDTLWIEATSSVSVNPSSWAFTSRKIVFWR